MEYPRKRTVYTVSEINARLRQVIEGQFGDVWIEGEVSNLRRSSAGHIYFTLKERKSQIPAVCFRSAAVYLRFRPRNGESFRVRGRLSTYEARGEYQIIVEVLEPAGRGALQAEFDRLKELLDREGLFDPDVKRRLPAIPSSIGIVTSPGSAALRDILSVLARRHDGVHVLIYPTEVQGSAAAAQISEGVGHLSRAGVDVIIVTRGGGSIEDLWPFNDEQVARAIAACEVPVISAVGHETDFVISDFAADLRAPTPSAAAEIVVKSKREVTERVEAMERRLESAIEYRLSELQRFLAVRVGGRGFRVAQQRFRQMSQGVDDLAFRLEQVFRSRRILSGREHRLEAAFRAGAAGLDRVLSRARERFRVSAETLGALSPLRVLERGYSVCTTSEGALLRSADSVRVDSQIAVRLHQGGVTARVTAVKGSDVDPGH